MTMNRDEQAEILSKIEIRHCQVCQGTGRAKYKVYGLTGMCETCDGTGHIITQV